MRLFISAAIAALAFAGIAEARTYADPGGRFSFDAPNGWSINQEPQTNMTYVIAGNADVECHVLAIPREGSASASPRAVRNAISNDANFNAAAWTQLASGITPVFSDRTVTVVSTSSEKDGRFWPIQRAELQGTQRLVHGALQMRPGLDLLTLCQTYEGADATAAYDALIRSVATPNDAALQAQAEAQDAAAAAPPQ